MKFVISGKNVEVTDTLYAAVESRLGKLDRYFSPETKCIVTLSLEKDRQKAVSLFP